MRRSIVEKISEKEEAIRIFAKKINVATYELQTSRVKKDRTVRQIYEKARIDYSIRLWQVINEVYRKGDKVKIDNHLGIKKWEVLTVNKRTLTVTAPHNGKWVFKQMRVPVEKCEKIWPKQK